ncbi:sigma-54-dependent Fis family transcriptional regulator [Breznakiellaceae bacterium SP9]
MLTKIDINKFNTLIEICSLINSNYTDVHSLLTFIIDSAERLCEGEASSLLLTNQESQELYFEVALGVKGPAVQKFTVKLGEGIAGWVAQHNQSLIIDDVAADSRHLSAIEHQIDYTSKTMLAVPMRIHDKCIGVIELLNKKDDKRFNEDDLDWLEIFANQAAIAIVNAQGFERARNEIQVLQDQVRNDAGYHTLVAKSPVILEKLVIVKQLAKTASSVLILGESGVGKELFAEQIHLQSSRRDKPFIRVNCAALPENLLESELFGHVKGAFTGAVANRKGRFELADGGTIFLDEIGDLPLSLQAKLLRVLQQRTFEKLGSDTTIKVDVRILAATNKDIESQVEKGTFRSDLYYRLNVLPLYIPPLRQRPEDILELSGFFLKKCMRETKKQFEGFSNEAIQVLLSYSWPGNVRELENCIERSCVLGNNKWITEGDLLLKSGAESRHEQGNRNLKIAINTFKKHFIQNALEARGWNQTETAKDLDIQRTYLSRLIKELEIITR